MVKGNLYKTGNKWDDRRNAFNINAWEQG